MNIWLNSKPYDTKARDIEELKSEVKFRGEIVIINGFATRENVGLIDNMKIFLITKGQKLSPFELENLQRSRNSPETNLRLKTAKVAICGLGGLGSNVAMALARIGVGELFLIDFDVVDPSNLNRQNYDISHLWKPKTQALKEQILKVNQQIKIRTLNEKITNENVVKILKDESIICECFDGANNKAMLINAVAENFSDKFLVAASGMAGFSSANTIKTTKLGSKIYICGDKTSGANFGVGLMSPRVMVCAGHQANMVLRIILNEFEV